MKASAYNAGHPGSIPGSGRSPGEGNGNPLQYSCLENPMGGGAWQATVHGVAKSRTRLSDFTFFHFLEQDHLVSNPGIANYHLSDFNQLSGLIGRVRVRAHVSIIYMYIYTKYFVTLPGT